MQNSAELHPVRVTLARSSPVQLAFLSSYLESMSFECPENFCHKSLPPQTRTEPRHQGRAASVWMWMVGGRAAVGPSLCCCHRPGAACRSRTAILVAASTERRFLLLLGCPSGHFRANRTVWKRAGLWSESSGEEGLGTRGGK